MLVLSRKPGERVYVGSDIMLTVVEVQGNRVKIGIEAPHQMAILRGELLPISSNSAEIHLEPGRLKTRPSLLAQNVQLPSSH